MVNSSSLISWLLSYGYFAIFLGSFLEVEAVLIMAGLVAHGSYLNLCWVMVIATIGSFTGDQLCFYLGNRHGWQILKRFPGLQVRAEKIHALLARYHMPLILGVRFMYGLRIAGPIVFGMSSIPWSRFLALNLLGALVWVITFSGVGYLFGQAMELELANLHHYEGKLLGLIVIGGIIFWLGNRWRQR